jgi:hypothetical protein
MSWLLFLDESGHDHKQLPYEVRGGVALHASRLWPFVRAAAQLELDCFGCPLSLYKREIKGSTLLDRKRFKFAGQEAPMPDEARRKHCRAFLTKGLDHANPTRAEFTAYGQACLQMADGLFQLLQEQEAVLFASAIPTSARRTSGTAADELLRRDHVFLFERFFYLLEEKREHGLLVFDETDKTEDRRFVKRMERYFTRTMKGRYRTAWIVPTPFFVASDMTYAVQAADMCIYCVNWGFRLPTRGMDAPVRTEIAERYGPWLNRLQYRGQTEAHGRMVDSYGIVYVSEPYRPAGGA